MSEYRSLFDARGARYNHANRLYPDARAEEAARILEHLELSRGVRWLDVGAGGGFLASRVEAALRTVPIGCDASPAFLWEARDYALRAVTDYERLPFAARAFRAAGCLAVLHHVEEPGSVMAEMLRVTARGGRVAIGDVAAGSRAERFLNEFVDAHTDQGHAGRFYGPDVVARFLRTVGGADVRAEAVQISWRFGDRFEAVAFGRELFGLREDTRDADLEQAMNALGLESFGGGCRIPWDMVFASAAA